MEPDITTESSSVMTYGGYSAAGVRVPRVKHETINNFHKAIVPKEENVEELNPSNDGSGYSAAGIRLPSNADRKHNKTKGRSRKTNKQDDEVMAGPQFSSSSHFAALSSQIKSMSDSTRHLDEFFAQKKLHLILLLPIMERMLPEIVLQEVLHQLTIILPDYL